MLSSYTALDLRPSDIGIAGEFIIDAYPPEGAATRALGLDLIRTGTFRNLRAKVYFQYPGQPMNTIRLYARPAGSIA
ncbi:MAG: hypothetical protein MO852_13930 [Candidatus Devosia euplotis]|nr:hypothetical protein [Candidatus Devosia euplotis]